MSEPLPIIVDGKILVAVTDLYGEELIEPVDTRGMTDSLTAAEFASAIVAEAYGLKPSEYKEPINVSVTFRWMTQEEIDALPEWQS